MVDTDAAIRLQGIACTSVDPTLGCHLTSSMSNNYHVNFLNRTDIHFCLISRLLLLSENSLLYISEMLLYFILNVHNLGKLDLEVLYVIIFPSAVGMTGDHGHIPCKYLDILFL